MSVTPPFTVSAVMSPETSVARISSLTLLRSIRPRAFSSVTAPMTDLSDTLPAPPQHRDLALHRLRGDLVLGAVHLDVGIDPGEVQGHPGRHGDGVVDLRRPAPSPL